MAEVLSSLRKPTVERSEDIPFEMTLSGQPVGFMVISLAPSPQDGTAGFDYRVESAMKLPNGMRVKGNIKARLNSLFEPISIEMRREVETPDGRNELTVEGVQVREKDIVITREAGGAAPTSRTVTRPSEPFVFGIEFLIQRVDFARHRSFVINELDPQEGTIVVQNFALEDQPDKSRNLVSRKMDGSVGHAFQLDESGKLLSWGEPPMPLVFQRCTESRIEELKSIVRK